MLSKGCCEKGKPVARRGRKARGPLRGGGLVIEQRESFGKLSSRKGGRERVLMPRDGDRRTLEPLAYAGSFSHTVGSKGLGELLGRSPFIC